MLLVDWKIKPPEHQKAYLKCLLDITSIKICKGYHIFSWLCAWVSCTHHIMSVASYVSQEMWVMFPLLSCNMLCVQIFIMLARHILSSVCLRQNLISLSSVTQHIVLYINQTLHTELPHISQTCGIPMFPHQLWYCTYQWVVIVWDDGLSPVWRYTIILANANLLSVGPLK